MPSSPVNNTNISGSISGELSQKAITPGRGMPAANSAAMMGMTPHEQKGESAPKAAAAATTTAVRPANTLVRSWSRLLARV